MKMNEKVRMTITYGIIMLIMFFAIEKLFFYVKELHNAKIDTYESQIEQRDRTIADLKNDLIEQHTQVILHDDQQLAYDIMYIDDKLNQRYLPLLIGRTINTSKDPGNTSYSDSRYNIDYYDDDPAYNRSINYYQKDYDDLLQTFEEDADVRALAVCIVRECLRNEDNDLNVPTILSDRQIRYSLLEGYPEKDKELPPESNWGSDIEPSTKP